jgi:hypothetical protein
MREIAVRPSQLIRISIFVLSFHTCERPNKQTHQRWRCLVNGRCRAGGRQACATWRSRLGTMRSERDRLPFGGRFALATVVQHVAPVVTLIPINPQLISRSKATLGATRIGDRVPGLGLARFSRLPADAQRYAHRATTRSGSSAHSPNRAGYWRSRQTIGDPRYRPSGQEPGYRYTQE